MKKALLIMLSVVMCISMCACKSGGSVLSKKSDEVIEVEEMIDELTDLPMETGEEIDAARVKIEAAEKAYEDLSEKDKDDVENYQTLVDERERLFENEYKSAALRIQYMNINSQYMISANVTIWDNVDASDFFDYVEYVLYVGNAGGYDGLIREYGEESYVIFWAAGYAFDQDYFGKTFSNFSSTKKSEIGEICCNYVSALENTSAAQENLEILINQMMDDYGDTHSKKMDALWDWWVESSLYADHALDPSGTLSSYISSANTYQENIERYQKTAGY